jgi:NAD(P)-dependent dehydrogenase (short-subunit alcohol dehydrogenase family)
MRHAVVTGSSSGMGEAVARRLLAAGWRVSGLDRAAPAVTAPGFVPVSVDLTDETARADVIGRLEDVSAIVHAAGVMRVAPLGQLDAGESEPMWRLHVGCASALADALAPKLPAGGRIVLIGSISSRGIAGRSHYAATKAALVALAKSWAVELLQRGVTVNVVSPATTDTAMLSDPARRGVAPVVPPIGRLIRPEEVAALTAFLLSEEAGAITGQEIFICGGATLRASPAAPAA